jgi:polysaccharide biosynthesis/export protein
MDSSLDVPCKPRKTMKLNRNIILIALTSLSSLVAQEPSSPARQISLPTQARAEEVGVLGSGDELTIREYDLEELNDKVFQVSEDGTVGMPMVGRLQAAGLTALQFEQELNDKLKVYLKEPAATVASIQYRSRPVSVLGAVNTPGVYQVTSPRTLMQMLSMAGGFKQDAGSWLIVTRKGTNSRPDGPPTEFSAGVTEIRIPTAGLMNGTDPRAGMPIIGNDVISVGKAELIYVMGDVRKPGGFVLGEHEELSLVKALSLAEGFQMTAYLSHSRILRETNGQLTEIPVDIGKILGGKASDVMLQPQDVLYVPTSMGKRITSRALEAAVQAAIGVAIWRQ